jgi:hypothetical protein
MRVGKLRIIHLNGEVELTDEVFASYNSKQWCEEQYETN